MRLRYVLPAVTCLFGAALAGAANAAPLLQSAGGIHSRSANSIVGVDYRPYYHCHGPKRCHGKGNYYKYGGGGDRYEPFKYGCRYGCGYNNGWNSPSSRFDYTGRRYGKHRRHRR